MSTETFNPTWVDRVQILSTLVNRVHNLRTQGYIIILAHATSVPFALMHKFITEKSIHVPPLSISVV